MASFQVLGILSTTDQSKPSSDPTARTAQTIDLTFSLPGGATALDYNIFAPTEFTAILNFGQSRFDIQLTTNHQGLGDLGEATIGTAYTVTWTGGVTTVVNLALATPAGSDISSSIFFVVGGAPFPTITSATQLDNIIGQNFTSATLAHDLGPGDSWDLGTIEGATGGANDIILDTANNWYNVLDGDGLIDGAGGVDMISFVNMTEDMTIDMATGTASGTGVAYTFQNFEGITGSIFGDYIVGDAGDNRIRGLGDYDWFVGSEGDDTYEGGNGRDMISYIDSDHRVAISTTGVVKNIGKDTLNSIERFTGSSFNDSFSGGEGEEDFRGMGGYDLFFGSGGGKDRYDGGSGIDMISYGLASEGVVASLLLGRGSAGDAARDLYTSIENLSGTFYDDILTGDHGRNYLYGEDGSDLLIGNGGVDRLIGGYGSDTMDGGTGWDYAVFYGSQSGYSYSTDTQSGVTTVTRNSSGEVDYLTNIEVMVFADGDVIL